VRDANGEVWFLTFDARGNAVAPSAAMMVASRLFWALGYNQIETFLTRVRPEDLVIGEGVTIRAHGKRRPFTRADLKDVLARSERSADGSYRVAAGRGLTGKILGGFRYYGTRPDDPNDVVPHEHRRELRALRVFGAWTNLTDLKSANTLDTLDTSNGRAVIKHYLQDVGSTFGLCNDLHEWDLSWEHFFQADTTRRRLFSLGFALSPWQTVDYGPEYPSIGKFEGDRFDPREWRPQTPTTAYMEARDDDAFWAARRIVAFTDDLIRAVVHVGEFSNPDAEKYLGDVLIKRRNKIASVFMTAVNPIVSPRLDGNGRLTFDNAAVAAGVAKAPTAYHASWMQYDNATDQTQPLFSAQSATTTIDAPSSLATGAASMIAVDISADSDYPAWKRPIRTFFRRAGNEWKLVGLERLLESAAANTAARSPKR
jgi:hypothetical protein